MPERHRDNPLVVSAMTDIKEGGSFPLKQEMRTLLLALNHLPLCIPGPSSSDMSTRTRGAEAHHHIQEMKPPWTHKFVEAISFQEFPPDQRCADASTHTETCEP